MTEDFSHLEDEERLKAENEFLKMKLMLEQGAQFGGDVNNPLSADIENQFLQNMMAFEKQFEERKTIKVFDKIGRPCHFLPVIEIEDDKISEAWNELSNYLNGHGIDLSVCSPNISERELYRFTIEELFDHEIGDMDLPGWTSNFIYDEFHPDPVYDNCRQVEQNLFNDIFSKSDLFFEIDYHGEGFTFNKKEFADVKIFSKLINQFKTLFEDIELREYNVVDCVVKENDCVVKGDYVASANTGNEEVIYKGDFNVQLQFRDTDYWYFKNILMNGFNLG